MRLQYLPSGNTVCMTMEDLFQLLHLMFFFLSNHMVFLISIKCLTCWGHATWTEFHRCFALYGLFSMIFLQISS
jgi:hypothetical protein